MRRAEVREKQGWEVQEVVRAVTAGLERLGGLSSGEEAVSIHLSLLLLPLKHLSGVSRVVCIHNPKFRGSNNITVRIQIVFSHHQQALLELDAAQLDIRRGQIFLKDFSYRQLLAGLETFQKKQFFILFQRFFIQLKPGSAEIMILKEKGTEA